MKKILAVVVMLAAAAVALAAAMPGMAACLMIEHAGLERLADGTLVDPSLGAAEREAVRTLREQAAGRVSEFVGGLEAQPYVAFLGEGTGLPSWLREGPVARTHFVAARACVVVSAQGRTPDIVAHELMHTELHARVGAWPRQMTVPTWFDEGVGMQVDDRPRYRLAPEDPAPTADVHALAAPSQFFAGGGAEVTRHYAYAKAEVAKWLARIGGPSQLAARLRRIRAGEPFESVWRD
ncbi:MAG: hypothetical protein IT162_05390 [Bryobacterales bacterium]|nr:hypothetical protein [Bryobacterales bacterium]